MNISAIPPLLSSLKAAKDIAQTMIGLRDAQAFQAKAIEFQSKIFDAQSSALALQEERSTLIERIRHLEKEMADLKAWGSEKKQYELKQVDLGAFAYVPQPDTQAAKQPHWLCANCYEDGKKSFLQSQGGVSNGRGQKHACARCEAWIATRFGVHP
ncbi:MAG: hypothetical protein HC850_00865 [Rhodomicrobium sp.]|nr:hypothetical protein [Rhodomicrobium sp.]